MGLKDEKSCVVTNPPAAPVLFNIHKLSLAVLIVREHLHVPLAFKESFCTESMILFTGALLVNNRRHQCASIFGSSQLVEGVCIVSQRRETLFCEMHWQDNVNGSV